MASFNGFVHLPGTSAFLSEGFITTNTDTNATAHKCFLSVSQRLSNKLYRLTVHEAGSNHTIEKGYQRFYPKILSNRTRIYSPLTSQRTLSQACQAIK